MKENKYNINKSKFKKLQWQVQSGTQPVCAWDHAFEHAAFCVLKEHFWPFTLSNTFAVLQVEWTKGIFALQTVMCVQTIQTACWTVFTAPARLVPMSLTWTNGHTQLAVGEKHTCVDIQTCIKIPALNIWQRSSFCTCIWEICRLEALLKSLTFLTGITLVFPMPWTRPTGGITLLTLNLTCTHKHKISERRIRLVLKSLSNQYNITHVYFYSNNDLLKWIFRTV